jgi:16S rRNA (guanine527-N7)-methyltransferase
VEHDQGLGGLAKHFAHQINVDLTDSQIDQLLIYLSEIIRWNSTINITSIADPRSIIIKHFVDSLTALCATDFPQRTLICDIGSGAGLPGIPLKIARPDLHVVLIESNKKKCSFLHSTIGLLKLENVMVFAGPIGQFASKSDTPLIDIAVVRALRFDEIKKDISKFLCHAGKVVLYRAESLGSTESVDGFVIESEHPFSLPENSGERVISVLKPVAS